MPTKVQKRDLGGGSTTPENDSAGRSTSDWSVALDDLKASLPNVDTVFLVVGWFALGIAIQDNCVVTVRVRLDGVSTAAA
jgi:hypothetical protein